MGGTIPTNVFVGEVVQMTDTYKGYLSNNTFEWDNANKVYRLTYEIAEDVGGVDFSGQIQVKLNPYFAYNGDKIQNAVKISFKDNGSNVLDSVSNDTNNVFTDGGSVSTTFIVKAKPQVNVVRPTARTCQDDRYPAGCYWNGTACVTGVGANRVATPNTGDGFNAWLYLSAGMSALAVE